MSHMNKFGIKHIRMKNDQITQSDFKNVLVVFFVQLILAFYVVFSTEIPLEKIYEGQLTVDFGVTRLITQIVMHILI